MYESLILVDPDTRISAEQLAAELQRFYEGDSDAPPEIALHDGTIVLRWPGYELTIDRESMPHVLEESAELARRYAVDHPERQRIARCSCRFSTHGEDDADMAHFNDYLFVGEAVARLGRVYHFDQSSSQFWE